MYKVVSEATAVYCKTCLIIQARSSKHDEAAQTISNSCFVKLAARSVYKSSAQEMIINKPTN
uniref:Uncharacterized protein n=1 Tax=Ciona intestinalis TaxID=7719 RepID=H2XQG8_CIOIN